MSMICRIRDALGSVPNGGAFKNEKSRNSMSSNNIGPCGPRVWIHLESNPPVCEGRHLHASEPITISIGSCTITYTPAKSGAYTFARTHPDTIIVTGPESYDDPFPIANTYDR